jgi:ERF superfamily
MQRSSDSIAKLATALAKAQIELVNPEKSLVGTIHPQDNSREGRTFNYASLASGLDIVRKTLGEHEIAMVQTTAVDHGAGIVSLTTVLAHSSGEWIASDWPVCALAETATPHRMGAALTYARRYALFTLVGIAGEDDLDAPDIMTPAQPNSAPPEPSRTGNGHLNGGARHSTGGTHSPALRRNGPKSGRRKPRAADDLIPRLLTPAQSTASRERLVAEINELGSADDAAHWARRSLPEKQGLMAADEKAVEEAFAAKLAMFTSYAVERSDLSLRTDVDIAPDSRPSGAGSGPARIDKSVLAHPEPRRLRDRDHIRYVAKQPCLICGRRTSDAHHLRFTQPLALGRKPSDEFTVPLCRGHHRELHRCGDESAWWSKAGIDPLIPARTLWLDTHPLPGQPAETVPVASAAAPGVTDRGSHQTRKVREGTTSKLRNEATRNTGQP